MTLEDEDFEDGWSRFMALAVGRPCVFVVPTRERNSHYVSEGDPSMCPCMPMPDGKGVWLHHIYLS